MPRIVVIGNSGSGKSRLAARLGERLNAPAIHLDRLYWRPGWVRSETEAFRGRVAQAIATEDWVVEGYFESTFDLVLPRAETIVWLDRSRLLCLWRVIARWLAWRGRARPDLADGCLERPDPAFWAWVWRFPRDEHPRLEAALARFGAQARILRLRSEREVAVFVEASR